MRRNVSFQRTNINGNLKYVRNAKSSMRVAVTSLKRVDRSRSSALIKATKAKRKQIKEEKIYKTKSKRMKVVKKMVWYVLHLYQNRMDNRKCLSEHPFGTIKRTLGQYYFLLKGFAKVKAEMGLFCLSYNLRRAINLRGVPALLAALQ